MTYCCNHSQRASELIDSAIHWITGTSEHEMGFFDFGIMIMPFGGGNFEARANKQACEEYREWMSNARSKLNEAKQELRQCNCKQITSSAVVIPGSFTCVVSSTSSSVAETTAFVSAAVCNAVAEKGGEMKAQIMQNGTTVSFVPQRR